MEKIHIMHKFSKGIKVEYEESENTAESETWGWFILTNLICFELNP